jgi:hypothetical protein
MLHCGPGANHHSFSLFRRVVYDSFSSCFLSIASNDVSAVHILSATLLDPIGAFIGDIIIHGLRPQQLALPTGTPFMLFFPLPPPSPCAAHG